MKQKTTDFTAMSASELIEKISSDFKGHWALNDPAHREDHFEQVRQTGLLIATRKGLDLETTGLWRDILIVAYFHDLFTWSRNNHHMLSEQWVLSTDYPIIATLYPTVSTRADIASACGQHRASYTGEFSSDLSELMSSADRGLPDLQDMIARSYKYTLHRGASPEEARVGSILHMKEKFGRSGYARYPELYKEALLEELEELWSDIDNL